MFWPVNYWEATKSHFRHGQYRNGKTQMRLTETMRHAAASNAAEVRVLSKWQDNYGLCTSFFVVVAVPSAQYNNADRVNHYGTTRSMKQGSLASN